MARPAFLGFDFSTQQLKVVGIDEAHAIVHESFVKFDADLPHYGTKDGVLRNGLEITSPTLMFVEALDLLLSRAREAGVDFSAVRALSGAAQQHGTVYWRSGADRALANLDPDRPLAEQLKDCFSVDCGPIWMDASTGEQCAALEAVVGGPEAMAALTGSRATERYSGTQILKLRQTRPEVYAATERISLVSSFAASLLAGRVAPIEGSDGAGMNLMDLRARRWAPALLRAVTDDLEAKLGPVARSGDVVGPVADYFVRRWGFPSDCRVLCFTGDNPGSLAGLRLRPKELCLSLGTSDVVMMWMEEWTEVVPDAVVLRNPVDDDAYMALLCFKNGSLVRERMRDLHAGGSWDTFAELLAATPKGNEGRIGMFFDEAEILPRGRRGAFRFGPDDRPVAAFPAVAEVRAVVEGQALARAVHAGSLGLRAAGRLLLTGGASVNAALAQVLADVFACDVLRADAANSAPLGGAVRAAGGGGREPARQLVARPDPDAVPVYAAMAARYRRLEAALGEE